MPKGYCGFQKGHKSFIPKDRYKEIGRKIGLAKKGHIVTQEVREKIREKNKGKHYSPSTEFKKGESIWRGRKHTEESKKKMSKNNRRWNLGKNWSELTKKKISESKSERRKKLGYWHSLETRMKIGLASLGRIPSNKGVPHSLETKVKISLALKGKLLGFKHPNWKGGITPEINKRINDPEWKKTRKLVYARDNWTCQKCGIHCHKNIQCHHIIPFRISEDNSLDNLITLCRQCHAKIEHINYHSHKINKYEAPDTEQESAIRHNNLTQEQVMNQGAVERQGAWI